MQNSILDKVHTEKPSLIISEDLTITISNDKKKVFRAQEIGEEISNTFNKEKLEIEDIELVERKTKEIIKIFISDEDYEAIEKIDFCVDDLIIIMHAILKTAQYQSLDEEENTPSE